MLTPTSMKLRFTSSGAAELLQNFLYRKSQAVRGEWWNLSELSPPSITWMPSAPSLTPERSTSGLVQPPPLVASWRRSC